MNNDKSKHIEDSLKFLMKDDIANLNEDFVYQTDYFNSQDYNYTLLNIEKHLNSLYEKARVLQDVIVYSREYIKQNVYSVSDECKQILDAIEDNIDSLKHTSYISLNVSFEESTGAYLDRDNKSLPKYSIYDGTITLSGKDKDKLKIKSIKQVNNFKPYKENINNLIEDKEYRSYYMLDAPIKNGLKEQVHVEFEKENTINQLNIITSNCKASDVRYIDINGTTDYIQEHLNVIQTTRLVKTLEFMTTTDSYKKLTYYVDQSRLKPNFWDSIMEHEYNKLTTGKGSLTQAQIDEMSGLDAFRKEYDEYTKKVEDWIARRTAVANENKSNGYSDSVPQIDFIVPPSSVLNKEDLLNKEQDNTHKQDKESYQSGSIVQRAVNQTPDIYPDTEKIRCQTYTEEQLQLLDKTGRQVEYFAKINKSPDYKNSYEKR